MMGQFWRAREEAGEGPGEEAGQGPGEEAGEGPARRPGEEAGEGAGEEDARGGGAAVAEPASLGILLLFTIAHRRGSGEGPAPGAFC